MTDEDAEVGGSAMADMTMEWIEFGLTERRDHEQATRHRGGISASP